MSKLQTISATVLVAAICSFCGCSHRGGILGVDCCADIPVGAIPQPAGTKVHDWQTAQVTSAIADQNVLYRADFVAHTASLSPAARDRISRNTQSNLANVVPWLIEPSDDPTLDSERVDSVVDELASRGVVQSNVQIAIPAALGLTGIQAERIARGIGNNRSSSSQLGAPVSRPASLRGI